MRIHEVQTTDGVIRRITAPESATQEDIMAFVDSTYPPIKAAPEYEQQGIAGIPSQQAAQQAAPEEESGVFRRYIGDNLLSVGQGIIGLGEAAVGLADIPTFGYAGKGVEAASDAIFGGDLEDASQYLQSLKTPEQLAQEQEVADAEGTGLEKFGNTIGALITNPGALANTIFSTLPQMAGGAAIARAGLNMAKNRAKKKLASNMKPATGKVTRKDALAPVSKDASLLPKQNYLKAAAYGEGIVAAGAAAESIRKQTEDGLLTPAQAGLALGSGVLTGVLGRVGGIAAQKLGVVDIDAAFAGQAISEAGQRKVRNSILQAVKAGIGESVFEELPQSMQEQMVQNIALDRDPMEGVAEAAAQGVVAGFALAGSMTGGRQFLENRNIKNEEQNKKLLAAVNKESSEEDSGEEDSGEEASGAAESPKEQRRRIREEIEARRAAKQAEEERNKGGDVAGVVPGAVVPPATTGANAAPAIFNISDFDSGRVVSDEEINELGYVGKTQRKLQNLDYEKPQAIQEAITILKNTSKAGNKNLNRPLIQEKINALEKLQAARQEQKALDAKAKKEEESKDVGGDVAGTTTAAPVVDTTAAPVVDTTAAPVVDTTAAPDVDPNALNQQAADEFGFYPEAQDDTDDQGYEGPVGFTPQVKSPAPDKKVFTQETLDSLGYSKTGTVYKELAGLTFGTGGLETAIEKLETTLTRKSKTKAGQNIAALLPKLKGLRATKNVKKDLKEATDLFSQDQLDDLRLMGATEADFKRLKSTKPQDIAAAKAKLIQIVTGSTRNPTTKAAYKKQINRLDALTPAQNIRAPIGLFATPNKSKSQGRFATPAAIAEGLGKGIIVNKNGQEVYISSKEYADARSKNDTTYETVSAKTLKPIDKDEIVIENPLKGNRKNPLTGKKPVKVGDRIRLARINTVAQKRKRKAYAAQLYEGVIVEERAFDPDTKEEKLTLFLKPDNSSNMVGLNDTQIVNPDKKDITDMRSKAESMRTKYLSGTKDRTRDYRTTQAAILEDIDKFGSKADKSIELEEAERREKKGYKEKISDAKKALDKQLGEVFFVKAEIDKNKYGEEKKDEAGYTKYKLVDKKAPRFVGALLAALKDKEVTKHLLGRQKAIIEMLEKVPNIKNVKVVVEGAKATKAKATLAQEKEITKKRREAERTANKNVNRGDLDPDAKKGKTRRVLGDPETNKDTQADDIKKRGELKGYKREDKAEKNVLGDAAGQYDVGTNTITVKDLFDLDTLLHEMTHAATARGIRNLKPKGETYKQLATLFAEAREAAELAGIAEYADMTSIDEFVTMAFTDPKFQKFLSGVKTKTKISDAAEAELNTDTLWRAFVNAVKAIVSRAKEGISGSVLNNVIALQPDLFLGPDDVQQRAYAGTILYNKKNKVKEKETTDPKELSKKASLLEYITTKIFSFDAGLNSVVLKAMRAAGVDQDFLENTMYKMTASQGLHATNVAAMYANFGIIEWNPLARKWDVIDRGPNTSSMKKVKELVAQFSLDNPNLSPEESSKIAHDYLVAYRLDNVQNDVNAGIIQEAEEAGLKGKALDAALSELKFIHLSDQEIADGLALADTYPAIKEIQETWDEVRISTINFAAETGIMSAQDAEKYIDAAGYVPFYRNDEEGKPIEGIDFTSGIQQMGNLNNKRFKGSAKEVTDIFENMDRWVQHQIRAGILNEVKKNKIEGTIDALGEDSTVMRKLNKGEKENGNVVSLTRNIKRKPTEDNPSPTEFITERYAFSDPIYSAAFGGLQSIALPKGFAKYLIGPANFLRQNVVLYPLFSLSQLPQDAVSAMMSSGVKNPFMIPLRVLAQFPLTLMGISKTHKTLEKFGATGGRAWDQSIGGRPVRRVSEKDTDSVIGNLNKKWTNSPIFKGLERFAMASDNAVRQAVYEQTMAETGNQALAVERAFEVINFRRKGSSQVINTLSQVVPFFSAGLQALSVQGRVMTGGGIAPGQRAAMAQRTILNAMMLSTVYLAYAAAMSGNEDYEKLDPKEKDNKLILPGGWSLPLRPDLFTFMTKVIPENILRDLRGDQDGEKTWGAISSALVNSISVSAIPQAIRPLIDVFVANESGSFSERRPIVPDALKDLKGADQFKENTSEFAIATAKLTGVSALKIDYFLRQYFGYTGGLITMLVDEAIVQSGTLDYDRPDRSLRDIITKIPGTTPFVVREFGNRETNDYYEMKNQVEKVVSTYNKMNDPKYRMAYNRKEGAEYYKENEKLMRYQGLIEDKNAMLSTLRERKQEVLAMPKDWMKGAEKKQQLDEIRKREREYLSDIKDYRKQLYGQFFD
jgi:hypothetical protein